MQRLVLIGIVVGLFAWSLQAAAQQTEPTKKITVAVSGMT